MRPAGAPAAGVARSPETRLLVSAARRFVGAAADDEQLDVVEGRTDWASALARAEREGMSGLVARELERLASRGGLAPPLEPWRAALRAVAANNMAALAELATLRAMLRRQGSQTIVLKGAALLHDGYREHVGLRPLGDVDLLVRPADLPAVSAWLMDGGYRPFAPSSTFFSRGVVSFDLHTEIVGSSWVGRKARAFRLDPAALWREATPLERDDPSALVLSPVHQQLHLVVHALKHSYSRLIWLVDLALVLRDASWDFLLAEARAAGALRPLAYALGVLDALLGLAPPRAIARELPPLTALERAFVRLVARRSGMEIPGELMVACCIPGVMGKFAYLAELGFPQRAVLARHYPMTPSWLLYPRRAVRLTALGVREGAKLWRRQE